MVCRRVHRDSERTGEQNQEGFVAGCNGMEMRFKPLQRLQAELRCRQAGKLTDVRPTGGSAGLAATTRAPSVCLELWARSFPAIARDGSCGMRFVSEVTGKR